MQGGKIQTNLRQKILRLKKRLAFTLAEVLITVGVIGVIAALTIPALINKTNDAEFKNAGKKAYSTLSNALKMVLANNNGNLWDNSSATDAFYNANNMINDFASNLQYTNKFNPTAINVPGPSPIWKSNTMAYNYKLYNSQTNANTTTLIAYYPALALDDGSILVFFSVYGSTCLNNGAGLGLAGTYNNFCGAIVDDVNGNKGPNMFGKDTFAFFVKRKTNGNYYIMPAGTESDGATCSSNPTDYTNGAYGCTYPILFDQAIP